MHVRVRAFLLACVFVHVSESVSASSCAHSGTCVTVCAFLCVYSCMMYVHAYNIMGTSVRACMCAGERVRASFYERACVRVRACVRACAPHICVYSSPPCLLRAILRVTCGRICMNETIRVYYYDKLNSFLFNKHFRLNITYLISHISMNRITRVYNDKTVFYIMKYVTKKAFHQTSLN